MSKYQESADRLANKYHLDGLRDWGNILELVWKEIPMKPIDINGGKYCGKCKQGVIIMNFKLNSCHNLDCRQVVDWSDE